MNFKNLFMTGVLMAITSLGFAQKNLKEDKQAIKDMCGCFEVTFKYTETFAPEIDYEKHYDYTATALEWAELIKDEKDEISIQHLLVLNDTMIIKHWRQDWLYENTKRYDFNHDNQWTFVNMDKKDVKGQWTQNVYQVDDSPRYSGSATWIHADGRHYWNNTSSSPLPRREYSKRSDYNVMMRGNLNETVIEEISINLEDNKVYLIKMGNEIGTDTPETGSVAVAGADRGWKKIRIVQENGAYKLLYANLEATTHQEIIIEKDNHHDFTYFSMVNENVVNVAPVKGKWDLNFTVFTEVLDLPEGGQSAYGFSDYVATNLLSNTKAYQVMTKDITYQDFISANIDNSLYEVDQRVIGAHWRDVFNGLFNDRYYIIQDTDGNTYKLKFTSMVNENGVRGYPKFEYQILN